MQVGEAIIDASDRLCWLAESCKIILLLLLHIPGMQVRDGVAHTFNAFWLTMS